MATDVADKPPTDEGVDDPDTDQATDVAADVNDDDSDLPPEILNIKPLVALNRIPQSVYNSMVRRYRKTADRTAPLLTVEAYQSCLYELNNPGNSSRDLALAVGPVVWAMTRPPGRHRVKTLIQDFARQQMDIAAGIAPPKPPRGRRPAAARQQRERTEEEKEVLRERMAAAREKRAANLAAAREAAAEPARTQPPAPTRREVSRGANGRRSSSSRSTSTRRR